MDTVHSIETLLTPREAAHALRIAVETLGNWRCAGKGPAFIRFGARIRYPMSAINAFIAQAARSSQ